jgi:hypothetical protein
MPRSYEDIRKAKLKAELETTTQEVQQMPPGYQAGGRVGFKNSNFIVDPFVMNVRGRLVTLPTQQQVSGQEWTVTRRNGYYYYLYVSQDRSFSVRPSKPVFDETLFAHKHPTSGDRLLGVGFVDSQGEMVYASSHLAIDTHEVTVVASDYVGEDYDYRCDGVADEVEINHAIRYMAASKGKDGSGNDLPGGGIVRLSPGTFNLSDEISMLGSITLEGSGHGTKIVPRSTNNDQRHGIYVAGTSNNTIDGCAIRNLRVQRSERNRTYGSLGTTPKDILAEHSDNLVIENNWIVDAPYSGIAVSGSKDFLVSGNIIQDTYGGDSLSTVARAIFLGSGDDDHALSGRLVGNEIYNTGEAVNPVWGINVDSPGRIIVANNVVRDLKTGTGFGGTVYGIYVSGADSSATISGNLISGFRSSVGAGSGCYGILVEAPNSHVVGNTIRDIQAFPTASDWQGGVGIFLQNKLSVTPKDTGVLSNFINQCDMGIYVYRDGVDIDRVVLSGNQAYDCGQLINHGHCEQTDAPMVLAETTPHTANCSWARSSEQAYEGAYSYKMTKTSGGSNSRAAFVDAGETGTSDLHGLLPGVEYTLEAWIYVPSPGSPGGPAVSEVHLTLNDYHGGSWGEVEDEPTGTGAWEKVAVTMTADTAATAIIAYVDIDSSAASNEYIYVDSVRLYPTKSQNAHENLLKDEGTGTMDA